jgi:hypothetical protein
VGSRLVDSCDFRWSVSSSLFSHHSGVTTMDLIISIENFEDGGAAREMNSPRTLEACLRSGLDPKELAPKSRSSFLSKTLTKEMVDAKLAMFEKKRRDKINAVKQERNAIIKFALRKDSSQPNNPEQTGLLQPVKDGASNMIEMVSFGCALLYG